MSRIRKLALLSAVTCLMLGAASAAQAAGALAIGKCDRHGWAYGYGSVAEASQQALSHCAENGDGTCHIVATLQGNCAAFAVDGNCGARGWAWAGSREEAETNAISYCEKYGGSNCTIRRWVCDGG